MDESTIAVIKETARAAAKEAVDATLITLGLDPREPVKIQRMMASLEEMTEMMDDREWQNDQLHLRKWRKAMDGVQSKGALSAIGMLIMGLGAAVWLGIKQLIHS